MKSYFTKRNIYEIIAGLILAVVLIEVMVSQTFFQALSQGIRIILSTSLQAGLWLLVLKVSLGERFSWELLGLSSTSRRWVGMALLLTVLALLRIAVLAPLALLPFFQIGIEALQKVFTFATPLEYVLFGISVVVIAPVIEEIVFRGFFYRVLRSRQGMWVSIITSALIFGVIHIFPLYALNAFLLAIPLAYLYEKSNSLVPGIILHVFNNAIFFAVMAIGSLVI